MSSNSTIPAYYKREISQDEIKKLKDIFGKMEKDKKAFGFLEPVDQASYGFRYLQEEIIKWRI